jgi:hypothetical protein
VDFVWTPAWDLDNYGVAEDYMPVNPDPRSRVWWDGDLILGNELTEYINGNPPLYDLFLVYEPDSVWGDNEEETDTPGDPDFWISNLNVSGHEDDLVESIEDEAPSCPLIGIVDE